MDIMAEALIEREVLKMQQGRGVEWGHGQGGKDRDSAGVSKSAFRDRTRTGKLWEEDCLLRKSRLQSSSMTRAQSADKSVSDEAGHGWFGSAGIYSSDTDSAPWSQTWNMDVAFPNPLASSHWEKTGEAGV